jgi:hypothetical protein
MDTTLNYQALALDIVMAAYEDAQGEGASAIEAHQWLETVDMENLGIEGLGDMLDMNQLNAQKTGYDGWE